MALRPHYPLRRFPHQPIASSGTLMLSCMTDDCRGTFSRRLRPRSSALIRRCGKAHSLSTVVKTPVIRVGRMEAFEAGPPGLDHRQAMFAAVIYPGENPPGTDLGEEIPTWRSGNHADR